MFLWNKMYLVFKTFNLKSYLDKEARYNHVDAGHSVPCFLYQNNNLRPQRGFLLRTERCKVTTSSPISLSTTTEVHTFQTRVNYFRNIPETALPFFHVLWMNRKDSKKAIQISLLLTQIHQSATTKSHSGKNEELNLVTTIMKNTTDSYFTHFYPQQCQKKKRGFIASWSSFQIIMYEMPFM